MISIKIDTAAFKRAMENAAKQAQFAAAVTLTKVAKAAERELQQELSGELKSASPYSTRGTFITPATPRSLQSIVGIKDRKPSGGTAPALILREHFTGRSRGPKPFERALVEMGAMPEGYRAMPGSGMKVDGYGNPNRRVIAEMLGSLRTNMKIARGRGKRMQLQGYFAILPGSGSHLAPGVYLTRGRQLSCIFYFVTRAGYRKLFDLAKTASKVVDRDLDRIFSEEFDKAMRTAR